MLSYRFVSETRQRRNEKNAFRQQRRLIPLKPTDCLQNVRHGVINATYVHRTPKINHGPVRDRREVVEGKFF